MTKTIEAYTHPASASTQEPDTYVNRHKDWRKFPCYYASVRDGGRTGLLAGPFKTHQEALGLVPAAKALAQKCDAKAVFYGFGTVKLKTGEMDGVLNGQLEVKP